MDDDRRSARIESLRGLEEALGHRFRSFDLVERALTHRSSAHERAEDRHSERLEFLGDAVLGLVTSEWLFRRFPEDAEGELARRKAHLVSAVVLAGHARQIGLGELLHLGVGEERSGGRRKGSLLADGMEAVLGAVYLDGGLEAAWRAIEPMLEAGLEVEVESTPKSDLQEWVQALGWSLPTYRVAAEMGPDHRKIFTIECIVEGTVRGSGAGSSKKRAEQEAAAEALSWLAEREDGARGGS